MQPAAPAGWLIAPVDGLRLRRTTAFTGPVHADRYTLFLSGLTATEDAPAIEWPSAQGPVPSR